MSRLPADFPPPVDPARAAAGARVAGRLLAATVILFFGLVLLYAGPSDWGLAERWGWPALPGPLLVWALLLAVPVIVLRVLPRRPERSFLCGARDALDRSHPANRPRPPVGAALERRLRRGALWCGVAGTTILGVAVLIHLRLMQPPPDAGRPLPRLTLAALAKAGATAGAAMPRYAVLPDARVDRGHVWTRPWRNRGAAYHDYVAPLTTGRWSPGTPVHAVAIVTVPDGARMPDLPPELTAQPLQGELSRDALPAATRQAIMRSELMLDARSVILTPMRLSGRVPGADRESAWFALAFGAMLSGYAFTVMLALIVGAAPLTRPHAARTQTVCSDKSGSTCGRL